MQRQFCSIAEIIYELEQNLMNHITEGIDPSRSLIFLTVHGNCNFSGLKVYETNEKDLVMEPAIRWAGNPNIVLVLKLMSLQVTVQVKRAKRNNLSSEN